MPNTVSRYLLPVATYDDDVDPVRDINNLATRLGAVMAPVPVGGQIPWSGVGNPADPAWSACDGGLIDRATPEGASFFAVAGHVHNQGVDPGSNMVRKPDKRGRGSIGAIDMGTTAGAGPNTNARAQLARGNVGGEVLHVQTISETPVHNHGGVTGNSPSLQHQHQYSDLVIITSGTAPLAPAQQSVAINWGDLGRATDFSGTMIHNHGVSVQGGGAGHNNLHPYETDNWIVRLI
jgi:microcystin-dependent protein